jgi:glycosyltransferase involved in cell wall biosynthesis
MLPTVLNVSQNYYVRGGSDRYFFALGELLERHGHRVVPFSSRQPKNEPTPWSKYFPAGVDFDSPRAIDLVRFIYSRAAAKALRRLLESEPIDLAHLHIYYGQLTASILPVLREAGIPIVQTVHDFKLVCPVYSLLSHGEICEACQGQKFWKATWKRCNRGSLPRSLLSTVESYVSRSVGNVDLIDQFIAVSNFQRHKLIELGVPPQKITTIHNFVELEGIKPEQRPGEYLLYFGRLEKLKGVFTLVAAARRVTQTRLLIAGRGEAEKELEMAIAQGGVKNVELVGFQQGAALARLVRGAIATILPSEGYDNCPMAILESYSHGRPVIGSRIGGIPELIGDDDGLTFAPGDAEMLARHMDWMFRHPQEAVEMGRRGRERLERDFNCEVHYQKIDAIYRHLLGGNKAPSQAAPAGSFLLPALDLPNLDAPISPLP